MINSSVKKILIFIALCMFILCVIGSTGYLFYYKQPLFALSTLVTSGLAIPFVIKIFKELINNEN